MIYVCQVDYIQWDVDEGEPPSNHTIIKVELDDDATEDDISDAVSDELSNVFGFCHKGFAMVVIVRLVRQNVVLALTLSVQNKQSDPLEWDWSTLLDLSGDEAVRVIGAGDFSEMEWSK
jgi:hypothetical protein